PPRALRPAPLYLHASLAVAHRAPRRRGRARGRSFHRPRAAELDPRHLVLSDLADPVRAHIAAPGARGRERPARRRALWRRLRPRARADEAPRADAAAAPLAARDGAH